MANGNGDLFKEYRRLLDNKEVPDDISRAALWGALAVVYEDLKPLKPLVIKANDNRKWLRVLSGISAFFMLIHLPDLALAADALWKLMLTLL